MERLFKGVVDRGDRSILTQLRQLRQAWLLVVDDLTDGCIEDNFFQNCNPAGTIIFTTRRIAIAEGRSSRAENCLKLGNMEPSDAVLLLRKIAGDDFEGHPKDELALAQMLYCLPLAIAQAGSYLKHHCNSITDIMKLIEQAKSQSNVSYSR
jgi:hypothetical protein